MIKDLLIPEVLSIFPDTKTSEPPSPILEIETPWEGIRPILIWDEGDEATISIGQLTHGHINPYDDTLTQIEVERIVKDRVLEFLDDLVNDKVVVWSTHDHSMGGWTYPEYSALELHEDAKYYVWSGEYERS